MTWTKEPAYEGVIQRGCRFNVMPTRVAQIGMVLSVGFGGAYVLKDGAMVYNECGHKRFWTVRRVEKMAVQDPDHDWRIVMHAPLWSATWQRHGPGHWVMIESGLGFA